MRNTKIPSTLLRHPDTPGVVTVFPPARPDAGYNPILVSFSLPATTTEDAAPLREGTRFLCSTPTTFFFASPTGTPVVMSWFQGGNDSDVPGVAASAPVGSVFAPTIVVANVNGTAGPALPPSGAYTPRTGGWQVVPGPATNTKVLTLNEESLIPIVFAPGTIDRFQVRVTTGGGAGSVIRLGLRAPATDGLPSATVLGDYGTLISTGVGNLEWSVSQVVSGLTWLSVTAQVGTAPIIQGVLNSAAASYGHRMYFADPPNVQLFQINYTGYLQAGVTGALPTSMTASADGGNSPMFAFRWA